MERTVRCQSDLQH